MDSLDVSGKTVLVRLDLNVPMQAGRVLDDTRIRRIVPTLQALLARDAKIVVLSHLGRPKGKFDASASLAPLVDALSEALWDRPVKFAPDCVGNAARMAVEAAHPGDVVLMENLRFHAEEEAGDEGFAQQIAALGDAYVNDAFSCSHRPHASITGLPRFLPSAAGCLMQEEVAALTRVLAAPEKPVCAIVGGSKISTKLDLLSNLTAKVDTLVVGGAMANTFLAALGHDVGASRCEHEMLDIARATMAQAKTQGCEIVLPEDVVVANAFEQNAENTVCDVTAIPRGGMILDIGPRSLVRLLSVLGASRTFMWNGPVGAYETAPFDASSVIVARIVAGLTDAGKLHSVAGGGDTVALLSHAGLTKRLSYLSTAGGAFLEWMEGKELPGITALLAQAGETKKRA
jgi:phosphoglycerate kinase